MLEDDSRSAVAREPRAFCWVCRRARAVCVCGDVTRVPTRTRVVILQDECEAWNHIGSARLAHLSLPGSELIVANDFSRSARLMEVLEESGDGAALLWPSREAARLDALAPDERPTTLVLMDATWPRAKEFVRHTPALAAMRRVRLVALERSRYRVRKQPRRGCLSTLEAAAAALALLEEGEERFRPLLVAFDRMIDRQIALAAAEGRTIVPDARAMRASRPLPPELEGDLSRIVLVQGETVRRWGEPGPASAPPLRGGGVVGVDLIQWAALRLSSRERFDAFLATGRTLSPQQAAYLGLSLEDLAGALPREGFGSAWSAFSRPDDVHVSWGFFASNELDKLRGARLSSQVDLRAAAKVVLNRRVRTPDDALWELEVPVPPPLGRGRCGARLAALEAILLGVREGRKPLAARSVSTALS